MRSLSCGRRILALQGFAGLQSLESVDTIPRCIPELESCASVSTYASDNYKSIGTESRRISRTISTTQSILDTHQDRPSTAGNTQFQSILQHPSSDFGSGSATSSATEEEPHEQQDDAEGEDAQAQQLREQLLKAALGHVKSKGWSVAALQSGAEDLHLSRSASGMVSNGAAGLVEYFVEDCNQRLAAELESRKEELAGMRVPDRVRMAVRMRLEMLTPYIDTWPQALGIQAHPAHVATAVRQRAELADDIWHACGDTSTDYNWYTKRGLLAAVYGATELFMLTDYSPGFADTWRSLDRRLDDVKRLGGAAGEVGQAMSSVMASVGSLAEWAQEALIQAQQRRQRPS